MGAIDLFGRGPLFPRQSAAVDERLTVVASDAPTAPWRNVWQTGEKFPGGFGPTEIQWPDYWTLRARSAQLFETNHYARGLIRTLVTNEIHTGLQLEATPEERILGLPEDSLAEWSENVENRFGLWARDPFLCDANERLTFGALEQLARQEALVVGDILVVMLQDQRTGLPRIRLINGAKVRSPFGVTPKAGNKIVHGVEVDRQGRHVAYWIQQGDGHLDFQRLPAIGEKSGRRLAWLVYGTDRRLDDVRGKPLLSLVIQSLREIDRYRDATQRKALVLSLLAFFIQKNEQAAGSSFASSGAVRRGTETTVDASGQPRSFRFAEQIPGWVGEDLAFGEEPKAFQVNGTTESFGDFEGAILWSVAAMLGIPPEIYKKTFGTNYAASQAAINEFKVTLNKNRTTFGEEFCRPIYEEYLLAEVLLGNVDAPGLLDAWRDPHRWIEAGAWVVSDWAGNIKPAVDLSKLVKGYAEMVREGFITRARAARELTGTKYSKNVQRLALENAELATANRSLAELEASPREEEAPEPEPEDEKETDDEVAIERPN